MSAIEPIALSFDQGTLVLSGLTEQALTAAGLSCFTWDVRVGVFRAEEIDAVDDVIAARFQVKNTCHSRHFA